MCENLKNSRGMARPWCVCQDFRQTVSLPSTTFWNIVILPHSEGRWLQYHSCHSCGPFVCRESPPYVSLKVDSRPNTISATMVFTSDCLIVEARPLTSSLSIASTASPKVVTSPVPPPPPASSITAPPLAKDSPSPLAYHVHRTASQLLPVYHLAKRGGSLRQTRIRKIEGDVELLRNEIRTKLGLKEHLVVINRLTGHIIIKVCGDTGRELYDCGQVYHPGICETRICS